MTRELFIAAFAFILTTLTSGCADYNGQANVQRAYLYNPSREPNAPYILLLDVKYEGMLNVHTLSLYDDRRNERIQLFVLKPEIPGDWIMIESKGRPTGKISFRRNEVRIDLKVTEWRDGRYKTVPYRLNGVHAIDLSEFPQLSQ